LKDLTFRCFEKAATFLEKKIPVEVKASIIACFEFSDRGSKRGKRVIAFMVAHSSDS
jgi:hypothetical protein